eukprot:m51a1_g7877 hypothetical protein (204) ;mRNA; r:29542-30252
MPALAPVLGRGPDAQAPVPPMAQSRAFPDHTLPPIAHPTRKTAGETLLQAAQAKERAAQEFELRQKWDHELREDGQFLRELKVLRDQADREHRQKAPAQRPAPPLRPSQLTVVAPQIEQSKQEWVRKAREIEEKNKQPDKDRERLMGEVMALCRQQQQNLREIALASDQREREFEQQLKELNARLENRAKARDKELAVIAAAK